MNVSAVYKLMTRVAMRTHSCSMIRHEQTTQLEVAKRGEEKTDVSYEL